MATFIKIDIMVISIVCNNCFSLFIFGTPIWRTCLWWKRCLRLPVARLNSSGFVVLLGHTKVSLGSAYCESFWRWHLCIFLLTSRTQSQTVSWHCLRIWRWPPSGQCRSCVGLCTHRQELCPPLKILLSFIEQDHSYCRLWSRHTPRWWRNCSSAFGWPAFLARLRTSSGRIQTRPVNWCRRWWWRSERLGSTFWS